MASNQPRSSSRSRLDGPPPTAPSTSYPPSPSPPRVPAAAHYHQGNATETDPLAYDTSPNMSANGGNQGFSSTDFANFAHNTSHTDRQGDEAYTAISLGEPSAYETIHGAHGAVGSAGGLAAAQGRGGSLDISDTYTQDGDLSSSVPRTSMSTHNSRSQLRPVNFGSGGLPAGAGDPEKYDSRPSHASPSVRMEEPPQSKRAERLYGSGAEKSGTNSGYSTPRSRSHDRSGSRGGLGQWSGPGANNTPYGRLGDSSNGYNSAASSNPNLQFAEGDFIEPSSNWFSRMVYAIYNSHYIVRWIIYIIPVLALLWIPAIVQFTAKPDATIWEVKLIWWSIWLTVVWCGWWGAALVARLGPTILNKTIGIIAPELRHYIAYVKAVQFFAGAAGWALANWISFLPLIKSRALNGNSQSTLSLITQGLFGIFLVLVILLVEKLVIQVIAHNFHKKSYEDRIVEQKFQIASLVSLYLNSRDIGRNDTLDGGMGRPKNKRQVSDPTLLVKKALKGAQKVAQTATTVIGTVASEIAGERVLQPNSPASMVTAALQSTNKTKHLARRIYYSFAPQYRDGLVLADISRCFRNREEAERAFAIFDRDQNGDASIEEVEMACLDIHRERLALSRSMRDIDSAVGRLDNIIMSIWYIVAILIMAGMLDASFNTLVASAGTFILGLSWLIGTTAQEILASIIFLFIKHAYDVGDRVSIDGVDYIVLEMHLLSTIFKKIDGTVTQAPHSLLNTKFVLNYRRSGAIWETFTWDVDFGTSFEKIEALRSRMLEFLQQERRDFEPKIDITVQNFEGQGKLSLSAAINYKSNWQNGTLKAQRRNKWICALKVALSELQIYGPGDAGNPAPAPADPVAYVQIPYDEVKAKAEAAAKEAAEKELNAPVKQQDPALHHASEMGEHLIGNRGVMDDEAGVGNGALRQRREI
ncbi:hypothetical protein JCM8547_004817 [Rhodosporidiobolus lusitaniae]